MSTRDSVRLEVERAGDGRWNWRYVDSSTSVDLPGNTTFPNPEEAVASARRAYPDVERVVLPPGPDAPTKDDDAHRRLLHLLVTLVLLGLLFEVLRRLGRLNHVSGQTRYESAGLRDRRRH